MAYDLLTQNLNRKIFDSSSHSRPTVFSEYLNKVQLLMIAKASHHIHGFNLELPK